MRSEQKDALWFILQIIMILLIGFFMGMGVAEGISIDSIHQSPLESLSEPHSGILVQENSLVGIVSPYYVKTPVYGCIIDCLIEEESNGDPNAYNPCDTDGYPKIGCLQYHIPTFQEFCVDKYGLTNDIWDCNIQKECADLMIRDGYLYRWGTASKCTK